MITSRLLATAAICLLASTSHAAEIKLGDLVISQPHSFETASGTKNAAGYMEITNNGTADDRLTAAATDGINTMLHKSETDAAGVTRMKHQMGGVPLPAGETVIFEPGGLHVMFMGLEEPFQAGTEIPVTLTFETAGEVEILFEVNAR